MIAGTQLDLSVYTSKYIGLWRHVHRMISENWKIKKKGLLKTVIDEAAEISVRHFDLCNNVVPRGGSQFQM